MDALRRTGEVRASPILNLLTSEVLVSNYTQFSLFLYAGVSQ
jgi:hypothetical protein